MNHGIPGKLIATPTSARNFVQIIPEATPVSSKGQWGSPFMSIPYLASEVEEDCFTEVQMVELDTWPKF